jgi:cation diffusion facilitator family transporter
MNEKIRTARLSIFSNCTLIVMKLLAGIFSGSVSIISEAIHSGMDLLASVIAFLSVKMSDTPPDKEHPYGHGKVENISGVIEAVLIFIAAGWIIYEAIHKIILPAPIENIEIGAAVMAVSGFINFLVSRRLYKVAKKTDSIALEADALHLKTDVYTSVGVAAGLLLIWITGWKFLDPIVIAADLDNRMEISGSHCSHQCCLADPERVLFAAEKCLFSLARYFTFNRGKQDNWRRDYTKGPFLP